MIFKSCLFVLFFIFTLIYCEEFDYFIPHLGYPPSRQARIQNLFEPKYLFIEQKLDHFDIYNNKTWKMRIEYNNEFFKESGPIFIMLGGEQPITMDWLHSGQMFDLAKKHNAFMIYTEHRFYGQSRPTSDLSIENLKYLTTAQALEDVIQVIKFYKDNNKKLASSKVVVFGGSYAGNMAIWIRAKYPKIIHAAVSSSAPVLAKVNFNEYHEFVEKILDSKCTKVISKGIDQILHLLGSVEGGLQIQKDFNLCNPVDVSNPLDVMYFFSVISTYFGGVVQYAVGDNLNVICEALLHPNTTNEYTRLAIFFNTTLGPKCRKNYYDMKAFFSNPKSNTNKRQWLYQTCTQFGYFQTTSQHQIFKKTLPITMYYSWCKEFFGESFTSTILENGVDNTNLIYGGLNINTTRVISVQGTADPWLKLGLKHDLNSAAPVIVINGTSHCEDLYSISDNDTLDLKNAKLLIQKYVAEFLEQNHL